MKYMNIIPRAEEVSIDYCLNAHCGIVSGQSNQYVIRRQHSVRYLWHTFETRTSKKSDSLCIVIIICVAQHKVNIRIG